MFQPTQDHQGRGLLSHLKISAPEIVAIVGGAVLSIGLLGAIVLVKGGNKIGGISAVTTPAETTAAASVPPMSQPAQAPAAPLTPAPSATAVPAPSKARSSATTGAAPAAKPSPEPARTTVVPRPRPLHASATAPAPTRPPATAAQRAASTVPKKAAPEPAPPAKTASVEAKASASHHNASAASIAKTAPAPRIAKPAPPLQRAPSQSAATKPAASLAPAPSKAAPAKTAQAGATAAPTTAPAPTGPVRIVIDYEAAAPGMSDMADQLARKLRAEGYKPVEIRPVQFIVSANQVRFFFGQDHDAAKRIEGIVAKVKDPGGAERRFAVTEFAHLKHPPPDNLVEVWLRSW